jgi:hypothetical protein
MAKVNPIRFSTKYQDDESDLLYYGYRYYKASTGTWVSRDPLGERGFELVASKPETGKKSFLERVQVVLAFFRQQNPQLVESFKTSLAEDRRALLESSQQNGNLYAFVANTPINSQDLLGLKSPSDGFTCDTNLLSALRILCHCVIARGHTIAGGCNGCWTGCNKYCMQEYLDGTMTENEMKLCSIDCYKRESDCVKSGCKLAYNP